MSPTNDIAGTDALTTVRDRPGGHASLDAAAARLAARYRAEVEVGDPTRLAGIYHPDVLLDYHVPGWRFQVQEPEAVARQVCVLPRPGRFATFDVEGDDGRLLVQLEWRQDASAGAAVVRQLQSWRLVDGRVAEQLAFCAGVWSRQLQARMAVESPLVRP